VEAAVEADFNRWCEEHVQANLSLPGFLSVRRFRKSAVYPGVGAGPTYLTIYQLEAPAALESSAWLSHDRSMPRAFSGRVRFQRSVFRELDGDAGLRTQPIGRAILHVLVDVDADWTARFLEWYAAEHVPAVLAAPGMIGARRFVNVELDASAPLPQDQHPYCTLYEMEDASVIGRPETAEAASKGACPAELEPHRSASNHVYDEMFRAITASET
jgi:hypothetical protein